MRLTPIEGLLKNFKGEIPPQMRREFLPREVAYEKLQAATGQDFGNDINAWEDWLRSQKAAGVEFPIRKDC